MVFEYLNTNWLKSYKEKFVSAWIDQHLNFNNRTTNRVEGQHSVLKRHLDDQYSSLDRLVDIADEVVKRQETGIKERF